MKEFAYVELQQSSNERVECVKLKFFYFFYFYFLDSTVTQTKYIKAQTGKNRDQHVAQREEEERAEGLYQRNIMQRQERKET